MAIMILSAVTFSNAPPAYLPLTRAISSRCRTLAISYHLRSPMGFRLVTWDRGQDPGSVVFRSKGREGKKI